MAAGSVDTGILHCEGGEERERHEGESWAHEGAGNTHADMQGGKG